MNNCKTLKPVLNAHAGGTYHGAKYTNCLQAFRHAYRNGARSFEIDISVTKDGKFVASHEFCRVANITEQEFLGSKRRIGWFREVGISLNLFMIAEMAHSFPDVEIMFDLHFSLYKYQRAYRELAQSYDFKSVAQFFFQEVVSLGLFEHSVFECYSAEHIIEAESLCRKLGRKGVKLQLKIDMRNREFPCLGGWKEYVDFCSSHSQIKAVSIPGDLLRQNALVIAKFHQQGILVYSTMWEDACDRILAQKLNIDYITVDSIRPYCWLEKVLVALMLFGWRRLRFGISNCVIHSKYRVRA